MLLWSTVEIGRAGYGHSPAPTHGGNYMIVTYQPVLVLLSIGIAIIGSLTALALTSGSHDRDPDAWHSSFVLTNGGLIMGSTIWSMHFIAMMAVELPVVVNYNLIETAGSICLAIFATGTALYLVNTRRLGAWSIPFGALFMGSGIAGMHYLGMSAIRGCGLAYDLRLVAASIVIAVVASMAALWFAFYKRGIVTTLAGGVVQGLAIASMHYTAMAATFFVPLDATVRLSAPLFPQDQLAYMIALGMAVISAGNLLLLAVITVQQDSSA
jgi:diguanylate cyclase